MCLLFSIDDCQDIERLGWRQKDAVYTNKHQGHSFSEQNIADHRFIIWRNNNVMQPETAHVKKEMFIWRRAFIRKTYSPLNHNKNSTDFNMEEISKILSNLPDAASSISINNGSVHAFGEWSSGSPRKWVCPIKFSFKIQQSVRFF